MEQRNTDEIDGLRPGKTGPQDAAAMERPNGRSGADSAGWMRLPESPLDRDLGNVIERVDALDLRLGGEVAKLREIVEIHSFHLLGKAIEALSSLEADWVRAQSEAASWREKSQEATLGVGELQQQLDRIADLRRKGEAAGAALCDELRRELALARQELARAQEGLRLANEQRAAAERECVQLQQRFSWRVMAPLRYVRSLFPKSNR